eukprot:gene24459-10059_t
MATQFSADRIAELKEAFSLFSKIHSYALASFASFSLFEFFYVMSLTLQDDYPVR